MEPEMKKTEMSNKNLKLDKIENLYKITKLDKIENWDTIGKKVIDYVIQIRKFP